MPSSRKLSSTKRLPRSVFRRVSNFPSPGFSERCQCQPGSHATPSPPPSLSFRRILRYFPLPANWTITVAACTSAPCLRENRVFSLLLHPPPTPSLLSFSTGPSTRVLLAGSKWRAVVKTTNSVGKLLVTKTFSLSFPLVPCGILRNPDGKPFVVPLTQRKCRPIKSLSSRDAVLTTHFQHGNEDISRNWKILFPFILFPLFPYIRIYIYIFFAFPCSSFCRYLERNEGKVR